MQGLAVQGLCFPRIVTTQYSGDFRQTRLTPQLNVLEHLNCGVHLIADFNSSRLGAFLEQAQSLSHSNTELSNVPEHEIQAARDTSTAAEFGNVRMSDGITQVGKLNKAYTNKTRKARN